MKTIKGIFVLLTALVAIKTVQAQPQCIGFKALFNFEKDSAAADGLTVIFENVSTWTDSNTYYQWYYGDGQQNLIFEESHQYPSNGNYTPCLYIYKLLAGDTVCRSKLCQEITIIASTPYAERRYPISIYPNPVNDLLYIETGEDTPLLLTLTDILGRKVHTEAFTGPTSVDMTQMPDGVYFLTIEDGRGIITQQKVCK